MQRMQQDSTFISGRLVHAKQKLCDFWLWKFLVMIFIELEECSPVLICHFRILCHMLQNDVSCSAIRTTQCELLSLWLLWPTWWSGLSILVKESIPSPWPCHGESQKVLGSSHKKSHGNASTQTNCPKINNANNSRATFRFLDAFIHIMHLQRGFIWSSFQWNKEQQSWNCVCALVKSLVCVFCMFDFELFLVFRITERMSFRLRSVQGSIPWQEWSRVSRVANDTELRQSENNSCFLNFLEVHTMRHPESMVFELV